MSYNKEEGKEYFRKRYIEHKLFFIARMGGKCVQCESTEDLEFDHIDPTTKSFDIGDFLLNRSKFPEIVEELKKCQLLCKSCHKAKSDEESRGERGWTHGTRYGWDNKKCICELCLKAKEDYNSNRREARRLEFGDDSVRGPRGAYRPRGTREHGTTTCYRNGCRCDLCKADNTKRKRDLIARNKQKELTKQNPII